MTQTNTTIHPLIRALQTLAEQGDRGALAALRRGLGQPPGTAPEMYRYVVPYLPAHPDRILETACYLVAALFALHPASTPTGDIGSHLASTLKPDEESDALERRFTILLASHFDDLPGYLRQAVSYLKSKDIPVNWDQLLRDLRAWDHESRYVQKRWAASFWGRNKPVENPQETSTNH
jgi:CRISPR type I-E-associated protein CasB/Cse2